MHYRDPFPQGKQAVLFLHGLGTHGDSWLQQLAVLDPAQYRAIVPDLPGFGKSPSLGVDLQGKKTISALVSLLDELGLAQVDVVGLSMGGVLAQKLAVAHPGRVRRLMLASTFARLQPANMQQAGFYLTRAALSFLRSHKSQAKLVSKKIFPQPEHADLARRLEEQICQSDVTAYRSAMVFLATHNLGDALTKFGKPVLVIGGDADTTVGMERQADLASRIAGARFVVVPGAGHALAVSHAAAFNREMLVWLAQSISPIEEKHA